MPVQPTRATSWLEDGRTLTGLFYPTTDPEEQAAILEDLAQVTIYNSDTGKAIVRADQYSDGFTVVYVSQDEGTYDEIRYTERLAITGTLKDFSATYTTPFKEFVAEVAGDIQEAAKIGLDWLPIFAVLAGLYLWKKD